MGRELMLSLNQHTLAAWCMVQKQGQEIRSLRARCTLLHAAQSTLMMPTQYLVAPRSKTNQCVHVSPVPLSFNGEYL